MRAGALTPVEAHEAIQRLLVHPRGLRLTNHARQKMQQRRVTLDDIFCALRRGSISCKPEWNEPAGAWQYKVVGRDCDDQSLPVLVAVEDAIVVITTYG